MDSGDGYLCITRPRRFGKSVNANMLGAYFTKGFDSEELFRNLRIAKTKNYRKHLNKHHVFFIDFSRMPDMCNNYEDYILDEWESVFYKSFMTKEDKRRNFHGNVAAFALRN
ncbi:MAG: AAA family ATPase [Lachnospiraceae bacterium]|nr:AAA family ATPase [Lachnospiraceae bacterium]